MTAPLVKAELIPYDTAGRNPREEEKVVFDFNPESLQLQVESGNERDRSRRGRQPVQHVGASKATLSFEAVFDATRPKPDQTGVSRSQDLDVRRKTSIIANLLQAEGGGRHPSPRRVRFAWGTVVFDGILESFQETLEFFSPDGVPLRSRLSLSLVEQHYRYTVPPAEAAEGPAGATAGGTPSLPKVPGFPFGSPGGLDLGLGAKIDLGLDVDLGFTAGAGLSLSADLSVSVFGGAAVTAALGADVDLRVGLSASAGGAGLSGNPAQARAGSDRHGETALPSGSWAQQGPRPGTSALEAASVIEGARAAGEATGGAPQTSGAFVAALPPGGIPAGASNVGVTHPGSNPDPAAAAAAAQLPTQLPVMGMAPRKPLALARESRTAVFREKDYAAPLRRDDAGRRPAWEQNPDAPPAAPRLRFERYGGGMLEAGGPFHRLGPGRPDPCFDPDGTPAGKAPGDANPSGAADCGCGG